MRTSITVSSFIIIFLLSSIVFIAEAIPPQQINETEQQETVDAAVFSLFTETAQVAQAATETAQFQSTVNARLGQILTRTAQAIPNNTARATAAIIPTATPEQEMVFIPATLIATEDEPLTFGFNHSIPGEGWSEPILDDIDYVWMTSSIATIEFSVDSDATLQIQVAGVANGSNEILENLVIGINGVAIETRLTSLDEDPESPLGQTYTIIRGDIEALLLDNELEMQIINFSFADPTLVTDINKIIAFDSLEITVEELDDPLCTPLLSSAIQTVENRCSSLDSNQLCYGNPAIDLQPQPNANVQFSQPGDTALLSNIQSFRLSTYDLSAAINDWGLALMQIPADVQLLNADDTQILLFGDAEMIDQSSQFIGGVEAFINVGNNVLNIRSRPGLDADIVAQPREGVSVLVVDGPRVSGEYSWWYVQLEDGTRGWAVDNDEGSPTLIFTSARLVIDGRATVYVTEGDNLRLRSGPGTSFERLEGLPNETRVTILDGPVEANGYRWWNIRTQNGLEGWSVDFVDGLPTLTSQTLGPLFGPMQAFEFNSELEGEITCRNMPDGMLIQTAEGAGEVRLLVNEVAIQMGTATTSYIEADDSADMTVNVLEGQIRVQSGGVGRVVPAGARVNIPLDSASDADGPVSVIEPYDEVAMNRLPFDSLKRDIEVAPATVNLFAGLGSGDVQVTLSWDNDADMDLYVTEPNGNTIFFGDRISTTNGQLDIDSNFPCGSNLGSIENIFWPLGESPTGTFEVRVNEFSTCGDGRGNWELFVQVDGRLVLQESGSGSSNTFSFTR